MQRSNQALDSNFAGEGTFNPQQHSHYGMQPITFATAAQLADQAPTAPLNARLSSTDQFQGELSGMDMLQQFLAHPDSYGAGTQSAQPLPSSHAHPDLPTLPAQDGSLIDSAGNENQYDQYSSHNAG
jgi:hypothetical protein